jgi:hypothetical protein
VQVTGTHDIESLWQINESSTGTPSGWLDAEERIISYSTTDMTGGDVVEWEFSLRLSADADASDTMYFVVTDNESEGVDCMILSDSMNESSEITEVTHTPGQEDTYYFYLKTDEYTPSGIYTVTVDMKASP